MNRNVTRPEGLDLDSPGRRDYWVALEHDSIWGDHLIPHEPLLKCGANVQRDDVVGLLHDFDHIDGEPWPARAGVDGVVVAQAWVAPIQRGQHIVVVGREC